MAVRKPSSVAINNILSTFDSEVGDGSNSSDEFSENQELDCEIVECNETNNDDDSYIVSSYYQVFTQVSLHFNSLYIL